jgi:dihydrofolate synthase/folylpolyglutamate synthase
VVITASNSPRAIPAEDLAGVARDVFGEDRVSVASDLPDAIDRAVQIAEGVHDMGSGVLIVGSVTLIADARIMLNADKRKGAGRAR